MHKKIKFFKNELLNMIKLTQFIKKFNGSFGPPYIWTFAPGIFELACMLLLNI